MDKLILNVINDNNVLAAVVASLILLIIVGVCGFFLYRKWFAHKKTVEDKLEEMEANAEKNTGTTTKIVGAEVNATKREDQGNELNTKTEKPIENKDILGDNKSEL